MRILFLAGDAPDQPDQGDRIRSHHILRALTADHDVHLLTAGERQPSSSSPLVARCQSATHIAVSRRQMQMAALTHPWLPTTVAARLQREVTAAVSQLAKRHQVDLIYAYQHRMLPHAWGVPGAKLVADLTDSLWLYRTRMAAAASWPMRLYHQFEAAKLRRFEASSLQKADLVLLASPEDAALVATLDGPATVGVVPNGVDLDAFRSDTEPPETPVLVFVGHMGYAPNVDGILAFCRDALPAIAEAVPNVRLRIVGKDPVPAVQALAADSHIEVTGAVPDVRPYLAQASVSVCPVRFGSGTRLKILEAMAAGRPVVSTRIGCEGLDVTPGRDLEVVGEPADMARPLIDLLQDRERRIKLAKAGRTLVEEHYGWNAIGRLLSKRITSL